MPTLLLLFLLYIGDLRSVVPETVVALFAGCVSLISSHHNKLVTTRAVTAIADWSTSTQMVLNADKCEVTFFSTNSVRRIGNPQSLLSTCSSLNYLSIVFHFLFFLCYFIMLPTTQHMLRTHHIFIDPLYTQKQTTLALLSKPLLLFFYCNASCIFPVPGMFEVRQKRLPDAEHSPPSAGRSVGGQRAS